MSLLSLLTICSGCQDSELRWHMWLGSLWHISSSYNILLCTWHTGDSRVGIQKKLAYSQHWPADQEVKPLEGKSTCRVLWSGHWGYCVFRDGLLWVGASIDWLIKIWHLLLNLSCLLSKNLPFCFVTLFGNIIKEPKLPGHAAGPTELVVNMWRLYCIQIVFYVATKLARKGFRWAGWHRTSMSSLVLLHTLF